MRAEIIAIGTELTTGAKLDTNSQWLSVALSAVGVPVHFHTTLADDLDANIAAFRIAADRADLVLITGGLGPTLDDLTREALARMLDVELVCDQPSLDQIRAMFARRNREMPERNIIQAMFPRGSQPIANRRGTAPGIWLEVARPGRLPCLFAALPGVPSEMKPMFQEDILPRLAGLGSGRVIRSARIQCFGLGESAAEQLLGDVTARGRDPEVGITVHEATITLRIVTTANSIEAVQQKIDATRQIILERLGTHVFGDDDEELEDVVTRLLQEQRQTLASTEGATAGLLARALNRAAGQTACYRGGLVAVADTGLVDLLGITIEQLEATCATGTDRAGLLATTTRDRFRTDFGLAVTARSRAADTEADSDSPLASIALAHAAGVDARELNLAGDPAIASVRLAKSALDLLRLHLLREMRRAGPK